MRRRWWWIAAIVAALLAAGTFWMTRPRAPFAFLEGKEPMDVKRDQHPFHVDPKRTFLVYTFRADPKTFLPRAKAELERHGFAESFGVPEGVEYVVYGRRGKSGQNEEVNFLLDTHLEPVRAMPPYYVTEVEKKGWVTVWLDLESGSGWWEEFVKWLGL